MILNNILGILYQHFHFKNNHYKLKTNENDTNNI